jgi:hypothetical protein
MLLITINFVFCGLAGGNNSNNIIILSVAVADDEEAKFLTDAKNNEAIFGL